MDIQDLPPELIINIIKFMDDTTFINFTNTNKYFQKFKKEKLLDNWYNYNKISKYASIYYFTSITHISNINDIIIFPKLTKIKIYGNNLLKLQDYNKSCPEILLYHIDSTNECNIIKINKNNKIKNIPERIKIEFLEDLFPLELNYSNPIPNNYSDYMQPWQVQMFYH